MDKPAFERYFLRDVNHQSGRVKNREIFAPNDSMREVQEGIVAKLRSLEIEMPSATGGVRNGSPVNNVLKHWSPYNKSARYFFLLDLASAYKNVLVSDMLVELKRVWPHDCDEKFVQSVMNHCLIPGEGLATGGNASPDIFNLCMEISIDRQIRSYAEYNDLTYTRYLDDLTFSSPFPIGKRKRNTIIKILTEAGCVVNHQKSQVLDIEKHHVEINGIGLRRSGHFFMPSRVLDELKNLLYRATRGESISDSLIQGKMGGFIYLRRKGLLALTERERNILRRYEQYLPLRRG